MDQYLVQIDLAIAWTFSFVIALAIAYRKPKKIRKDDVKYACLIYFSILVILIVLATVVQMIEKVM